jgi:glyoxylase-like metal-dependent hydrolase (beta-lactamase superfamily II)
VRIGDIDITPLSDGELRIPPDALLSKPASEWPDGFLDADGLMGVNFGGFLVRTRDRLVIVDTGIGGGALPELPVGTLPRRLAEAGVHVDDVTDVIFTHLHFDHVGWATKKGEVVFPNATYRVHADDWAHFVESPEADAGAVRKLSPLTGRLEPFTADGSLAPGLDARHTPGHTPGSTVYVVSSGAERALLLGDVVHSVVELAEPDWEAVFDVDPVAARAARNVLADEVADTTDLVVGAHFPGLRFGRVVTAGGGRTFRSL